MKQKFSDRKTIYIQTALTLLIFAVLIVLSYGYQYTPDWANSQVGMVGWLLVLSFIAVNIAGVLMYAGDLLYYRIQVYRHGHPHEQIEDI